MIHDSRQAVVVYLHSTDDAELTQLRTDVAAYCERHNMVVSRTTAILRFALEAKEPALLCSLRKVIRTPKNRTLLRTALKAGRTIYACEAPPTPKAVPELFLEMVRQSNRQKQRDTQRELAPKTSNNKQFRRQKVEAALISSQKRAERADRAYNYIMPEVIKMQDDGKTLHQIVDHLNETGRLTSVGQPWNISTLSRRVNQYRGKEPQLGTRKKPTKVTNQLKKLVVGLSEHGYTTASIARVLDMGYQTVSTIRRENDVQPSHLGELGGDLVHEAQKALNTGMGVVAAAKKLNLPKDVLENWANKTQKPIRQDAGLMTVGGATHGDVTKGSRKGRDTTESTTKAGSGSTGKPSAKKAAKKRTVKG